MGRSKLSQSEVAVTERKLRFAELVGQGLQYKQAGKQVGLTSEQSVAAYKKDPLVQQELKKINEQNRRALTMSREKVQGYVMEAMEMARIQADPVAMLRGVQELNKMCGFYAPEEKKVILTSEQRRMVSQFDEMSDEDIARVASEGVIEAEFEEVDEPAQLEAS